jgi:hypothetical protein
MINKTVVLLLASAFMGVLGNLDGQICTDASYWTDVEYKPEEHTCCTSKVTIECEEEVEQVCVPVEKMVCEVVGWSDCKMAPCPVTVAHPEPVETEFIERECRMVPHNISHVKVLPKCENVTKRICTTLWDRDADGNPVWKGEDDCKDVHWLECHDEEVDSVIETVKSECEELEPVTFKTCTNATSEEIHMCTECEAKAVSDCHVETTESCVDVTVKSCKPVATDNCKPTEFLIPSQEFVHQDKCLFDPSGNPHHGGDHDHDHEHEHHHHEEEEEEEIDIVVEEETPLNDIDLPEQSPEIIEDEVEDEAVEEVVVDESPVEAEVGYRNLSPEIPLNANLSPERQSRSQRPLIFDLRNKLFNGFNPSFNSRNFYRGA